METPSYYVLRLPVEAPKGKGFPWVSHCLRPYDGGDDCSAFVRGRRDKDKIEFWLKAGEIYYVHHPDGFRGENSVRYYVLVEDEDTLTELKSREAQALLEERERNQRQNEIDDWEEQ